jgi:O-antigen/teichoic acid export membrane protein
MKAFPFFKSLVGLLILNALVKPLWIFGVDRQVQNIVGHEAYGTYFSLLNLSLVFSFVTDAGLSNMVNRQVASGMHFNIAQLLRLKVALAAVYVLLVGATAWLAGVQQWFVLVPVVAIQILLSLFNFLRSLITAHQFFNWDVWLSVIDKVLMLLFFLPLLYSPLFQRPITILFFLQAQLFCGAAAVLAALCFVLKKKLLRTTAAVQKTAAIIKSIAPYALIILGMTAHNRLDGFLLERLHSNGAYEAGVYASSYRLLDAANMVGYLVASFLVPFLARHKEAKPLLQQTVSTAGYGLLLFGSFTTLFVVLFARPVQQALYPASPIYASQVLQWCLPVLPAYLALQVYGSLLTAMGQLRQFVFLLAVAVLINIVLNGLLIPQWGAIGCCIAALVSQYVCATSVYLFAMRKTVLHHDGRGFIYLVITTLLLGCLFLIGRWWSVPLLLLFLVGSSLAGLALFAYLPFFKRSLILFH